MRAVKVIISVLLLMKGKKYDKTRYWMYGGNAFSHKCEEIIGPRYPKLFDLLANVFLVPDSIDPRPSFLDEYLAVTGNGGGGLDEYWDAILQLSEKHGWCNLGFCEHRFDRKDQIT